MNAVDLIVLAPDRPDVTLLVEVKVGAVDMPRVEKSIKEYMLLRRCGLALVVTPASTWLYRDTFRDFSEESIEVVGQYPTAEFFNTPDVPDSGSELERVVRDWLTQLASNWPVSLPAAETSRKTVVEHIVPAVVEGRVLSGNLGR
ncbi:MAG: hypothetical protein MUF54_24550 [Polyangiaceae bacterium]|jgi:hypothetical protein|nr:hypothetical protein [Polyangiaceae bacterium]